MNKVKLGELFQIKQGFAFKSKNYVEKSKYALVTLANFSSDNNFQYVKDKMKFYGSEFPSEYILEEGDLIMPLTEQVVGLFGNTAFVPNIEGITFVLNQRVGKVIPIDGRADKYFLHYLLAMDEVKEQLEYRATGTRQRNISPNDIYELEVYVPDIDTQRKIGRYLYNIERKINLNNQINSILSEKLQAIYNFWFSQFDFPDVSGNSYRMNNGQFKWSEVLNREIPKHWTVASIGNNSLTTNIKPGVDFFDRKTYFATADVKGTEILDGTIIEYENRETRANMQPKYFSVWFAKMKNSKKHLFLNPEMKPIIDTSILSTGFCGLDCKPEAFEYISSFISHPNFEEHKDFLAHGATQKAINVNDLARIPLLIPDNVTLSKYHKLTKPLYAQIANNICENRELTKLKIFLYPLLVSGQVAIKN